MLPERIFTIGGVLTIAAGVLLVVAFVLSPVFLFYGPLEAGALLIGFGVFFIYVGRGARRDRRRLTDLPEPPH
jgi:hypothetical protein